MTRDAPTTPRDEADQALAGIRLHLRAWGRGLLRDPLGSSCEDALGNCLGDPLRNSLEHPP